MQAAEEEQTRLALEEDAGTRVIESDQLRRLGR